MSLNTLLSTVLSVDSIRLFPTQKAWKIITYF